MKRYLTVGINAYEGQELAGCVNDAYDWAQVLSDRGFVGTVLIDADATRANITAELREMLALAKYGDTVVFQFSGHGTWLPDADGDEADRRDEALVPFDYADGGLITDDGLHTLVRDNRGDGVKTLIVADSCHSGTVMRALGSNERSVYGFDHTQNRPRARFMPPVNVLHRDVIPTAERVQGMPTTGTPRTGAALMSACTDGQLAWDVWSEGRPNGAFTLAALKALQDAAPRTLRGWLAATLAVLDYDQTPQISGTWWQRNMSRFV